MGAEIQDGAVLVARAILNSSLWTMSSNDRIVAITAICVANWKPRKWFDGEKEIMIDRGQFVRSWQSMADECNLSVKEVRTSIDHLEKVGFVARKRASHYSIFTIPKYQHYQDLTKYSDSMAIKVGKEVGRLRAGDGQDAGSKRATNNNVIREEGKKEELCAEATASTPHSVPFELLEFELYAKDRHLCKEWTKLLGVWGGTYPAVNIIQEIKRAHSWQLSDPKRRKTKQARFLDSWLRRAQDSANGTGQRTEFAARRDASGPPKL